MATALHDDLNWQMMALGRTAKAASAILQQASAKQKNQALEAAAAALESSIEPIMAANKLDLEAAAQKGLAPAMLDRLALNDARIHAMAEGLRAIAKLADPVGAEIARWQQPNGLDIARIRTPLGVIGVIYESRPNVTADAGALCLKSGNAAILRGGSESFHSSAAILACLHQGLKAAGLPEDAIQSVPTRDRDAVGIMLKMTGLIDVIVPRGGRGLTERVQNEAKMPVFAHLDGICHLYLHTDAEPSMARSIALNAKMRRTGICGAAETILCDRAVASKLLPGVIDDLIEAGCAVRGDDTVRALDPRVEPASDQDWSTEYLDAIISIRVVDDLDQATAHIAEFSSNHTESIITSNEAAAQEFLNRVDSAIVMHNASTQFADGGEFGMGAEIGIATGRMHARGPVGVEQLTTFKYVVRGQGQIRPV